MKAIPYLRVSTHEQGVAGVSLDAQKTATLAELERRGYELVDVAGDTASGAKLDRPGLERALERLDRGEAEVLVVARLDRLSRSVLDLFGLMERAKANGWAIVCLDPAVDMTTPFGEAMAGMAAVFAQLERRLISQRTKEAVAQRKAAGTYRNNEPEIPPDVERIIVRAAGRGRSQRQICRQLEAEGILTPRGRQRWSQSTVQRVLRRASSSAAAAQLADGERAA